MKKILLLALLSIFLFILDNVLIPFFAIKTIYPSLLLVFIICYSIVNGKWEGLWLGVFAGLLQDLYFSSGFGINSFTNMLICLIAGVIGDNIFKEKRLVPVTSCFLMCFLKGLLILAILYLAGTYVSIKSVFFISVYNMFICIFIYKRVYKLCEKDYMEKRWKF